MNVVNKCDLSLYVGLDLPLAPLARLVSVAEQAVLGGATVIQLREETSDAALMIPAGLALKAILDDHGIPLIVNESLDAALAIGASGIQFRKRSHLLREARERLGEKAVIGITTFDVDVAAALDPDLVDFVGTGPTFEVETMPDWVTPIGLQGLRDYVRRAPCPVIAMGGVEVPHVESVLQTGVDGIGVPISVIPSASIQQNLSVYADRIKACRRISMD